MFLFFLSCFVFLSGVAFLALFNFLSFYFLACFGLVF